MTTREAIIEELSTAKRSCVVSIDNATGVELKINNVMLQSGKWHSNPAPAAGVSIPAGKSLVIAVKTVGAMTGVKGSISLNATGDTKRKYVLHFENSPTRQNISATASSLQGPTDTQAFKLELLDHNVNTGASAAVIYATLRLSSQ